MGTDGLHLSRLKQELEDNEDKHVQVSTMKYELRLKKIKMESTQSKVAKTKYTLQERGFKKKEIMVLFLEGEDKGKKIPLQPLVVENLQKQGVKMEIIKDWKLLMGKTILFD